MIPQFEEIQTNSSLKFRLESAAVLIPHKSKEKRGGEDAVFASKNGRGVGVADGVGGWINRGVDSGIYARNLMQSCGDVIDQYKDLEDEINPVAVMETAREQSKKILGSATCVISVLNFKNDHLVLTTANLGDSGMLLFRGGELVMRTKEQQHSFNFPYQIGTSSDLPHYADVYESEVEIGDLVVVATDGVLDNLYAEDIQQVLANHSRRPKEGRHSATGAYADMELSELALDIAKLSHQMSYDAERLSPFSVNARASGYTAEIGGKDDDIAVLVARVTPGLKAKL